MTTPLDPGIIRGIPLFASLSEDEVERLVGVASLRTIPEGALLFSEGEGNGAFCCLLDGQVEVIKALGMDGERLLGVRGPGSFFGEMSLFSSEGLHTASVRARTPLKVLQMARADLRALLERQPGLAYEMVAILSRRLEESENLTIRDVLEKNRQLTEAYDELRAAQAQLVEKERLEAELAVARRIQRSILPGRMPRLPGLAFSLVIEPMHSVGGDLYDFIPLGRGRLGIAVGDVSGHGVPAAIFMALTYSLLRAEASRTDSSVTALRRVNSHLLSLSDSGMFVTMLYGVLDAAKRQFTYVRAGHPSPLLLDAHGQVAAPPAGTGQPLAMFDHPLLDQQTVTVPDGGLLLLYTDGVTEAVSANREEFGLGRLQATLSAYAGQPAEAVCRAVYAAVRAHCGDKPPHDDILLVAAKAGRRYEGDGAAITHRVPAPNVLVRRAG